MREAAKTTELESLTAEVADETERRFVATQWQLMWWKFRKHRLAIVSAAVVIALYVTALFCEFIAPYDPNSKVSGFKYAPPQRIHFIDAEGRFSLRPFVYGLAREQDPDTLRYNYSEDETLKYPIKFFAKGERYEFWGLWETDVHLVGLKGAQGKAVTLSLLGRDRMGRDMLSRVVYGTRISMSIGLVGVALSLSLGILLGGISGY